MKSLIFKSLLVVSLVTVASLAAWSQASKKNDPCETWNKDEICDFDDKNLKKADQPVGATEGNSADCKSPDQRCFKRKGGPARLKDQSEGVQPKTQAPDQATPAVKSGNK